MNTYLTFNQLEKVGRLGNQLWQIASTIGLARRHGMQPRFPASWSYRPYFMVPDEFFTDDTINGTPALALEHELAHMDTRTRIYLQDLDFIRDVEEEIRLYFHPSDRAKSEVVKALPPPLAALVIHVRRGDNLTATPGVYPIPRMDYYLTAVREHPRQDVVIYGDDDDWNRNVLRPQAEALTDGRVFCVRGVPRPKEHMPDYMSAPILDWIDLFAMRFSGTGGAFCLSNSTMGWWAAWLARSEDVRYPDPWYGPLLDIHAGGPGYVDGTLMMPKEWKARPA